MTMAEGADTTQVRWPELTLAEWTGTRDALHLWTQVVGKVRLRLEPMVNHWWQVPLYVSARGLTTSLMEADGLGLEMEFDFLTHRLEVRTAHGAYAARRTPSAVGRRLLRRHHGGSGRGRRTRHHQSVAPGAPPTWWPFPDDTATRPYDADAVQRFWLALVQMHRVMQSSAPASRARSVRCTSSGVRPTWPLPASRADEAPQASRRDTPIAPTGCSRWPTATR